MNTLKRGFYAFLLYYVLPVILYMLIIGGYACFVADKTAVTSFGFFESCFFALYLVVTFLFCYSKRLYLVLNSDPSLVIYGYLGLFFVFLFLSLFYVHKSFLHPERTVTIEQIDKDTVFPNATAYEIGNIGEVNQDGYLVYKNEYKDGKGFYHRDSKWIFRSKQLNNVWFAFELRREGGKNIFDDMEKDRERCLNIIKKACGLRIVRDNYISFLQDRKLYTDETIVFEVCKWGCADGNVIEKYKKDYRSFVMFVIISTCFFLLLFFESMIDND